MDNHACTPFSLSSQKNNPLFLGCFVQDSLILFYKSCSPEATAFRHLFLL